MKDKLNEKQGQTLLQLARRTIGSRFDKKESQHKLDTPDDPAFLNPGASFVTLKLDGKLRGCIGNLEPSGSLWDNVGKNAISAAFHDHRFSALTANEWRQVTLDISVLTEPKPLNYKDAEELVRLLRPGIDGVILRDEGRGATFLPQVWEQLPTVEQFLTNLCLKAGLAKDHWRQAKPEISIYQVQYFKEENQ